MRLAQVVANLLNNAAKYTPDRGKVSIGVRRDGPDVTIRVTDNGIGIPPDVLPRVFDLFVQADRSLDRSRGGLGLGLTLVRQLVELHGGSVAAHSAGIGHGSEFTVRLPLAIEPAAQDLPGSDAPAGEKIPKRFRVLVVDDHADSAAMLAELLNLYGQETRTALNGPSALDAVDAFRPDLVLLDIGLPDMDGYEVARRLRTTVRQRLSAGGPLRLRPRGSTPAQPPSRLPAPSRQAGRRQSTPESPAAALRMKLESEMPFPCATVWNGTGPPRSNRLHRSKPCWSARVIRDDGPDPSLDRRMNTAADRPWPQRRLLVSVLILTRLAAVVAGLSERRFRRQPWHTSESSPWLFFCQIKCFGQLSGSPNILPDRISLRGGKEFRRPDFPSFPSLPLSGWQLLPTEGIGMSRSKDLRLVARARASGMEAEYHNAYGYATFNSRRTDGRHRLPQLHLLHTRRVCSG